MDVHLPQLRAGGTGQLHAEHGADLPGRERADREGRGAADHLRHLLHSLRLGDLASGPDQRLRMERAQLLLPDPRVVAARARRLGTSPFTQVPPSSFRPP